MNGTLAVWYEPSEASFSEGAQPLKPKLEIHFNLWRDPPSRTDFLDIGLKLSDLDELCRFYVYFPVALSTEQISDLSKVMSFGQTLDAVFNTVVEKGLENDNYYIATCKGKPFVTVHNLTPSTDLSVERVEDDAHHDGCILTFSQNFCNRLKSGPQECQYIRLRIKLGREARKIFTEEITAKDRLFVTLADKLELTELRLNEQRSYPASIAKKAQAHTFDISRVHYFLIRDLGHTLIAQHAPLRKVRRLEPSLWASYLKGENVPAGNAGHLRKVASRLVIYHWREGDGTNPIEDFTAFATFRATSPGLLFYLLVIIALGAIGSTLSTMLVTKFGPGLSITIFTLALPGLWLINILKLACDKWVREYRGFRA